jgi:hypothetical protein
MSLAQKFIGKNKLGSSQGDVGDRAWERLREDGRMMEDGANVICLFN